jgi:hypothetical protein
LHKKDYKLTKHAIKRMIDRNISINEVEKVIADPDIVYPGKRGEINIVKRVKKDKKIRLVYIEEKKLKIIITAMVVN